VTPWGYKSGLLKELLRRQLAESLMGSDGIVGTLPFNRVRIELRNGPEQLVGFIRLLAV